MRDEYVGPVRTQLAVLFAAVGLVLLIACVNVANLLLARAAAPPARDGGAIGARREPRRLITQTLVESLPVAIGGGIAGLAIALGSAPGAAARLAGTDVGRRIAAVGLDLRVLGFAFALTLLTGVLFGLLPALSASRPDVAEHRQGGRPRRGRRAARRSACTGDRRSRAGDADARRRRPRAAQLRRRSWRSRSGSTPTAG